MILLAMSGFGLTVELAEIILGGETVTLLRVGVAFVSVADAFTLFFDVKI